VNGTNRQAVRGHNFSDIHYCASPSFRAGNRSELPIMHPVKQGARVAVIGGGLAGCEAAWQLALSSVPVLLYEMKPTRFSPAHSIAGLAELVCSNSLRSDEPTTAVGLLKEEMRSLSSLVMEAAERTRVPAGKALAVDRTKFSARITERIAGHPLITSSAGRSPLSPTRSCSPWRP
jgi:tRNA:m(5)U-54 methyltransferase